MQLNLLIGCKLAVFCLLLFLVCSAFIDSAAAEIDFSRDVLPILSDACFKCHGPDEGSREADLRLDDEANAKEDRGGYSVVVAGDAKQSELLTRVLSQDASEVMPPPDTGKTLTDEQVETLRQWIQQGAKWTTHWAFEAPTRSIPPAVADKAPAGWSQHPIDAFVLRRIEDAGLTPSPPASAETLLRRLHLDLIGLPPTLEERRAFLADARPDAIDQVIDQLLDSPHYGERWGRHWLDAARYSDSDGYEKDMRRQNWHYRDWVVNAINADKPYDQFIVEQIAGDLLPNAGQDEFVATGFLRNSMVNEEGGADPEQFRVEGLFDRMDAIGKSVLGITTQCAQCHTHKYDPLTHADYFGMFAFLNNCNESITPVYTDDEQRQIVNIREQIEEIEMALRESTPDWRDRIALWKELQVPAETDWHVLRADRKDYTGQKFAILTDGSILSQSYAPPRSTDGFIADSPLGRITAIRLEMLTHPDLPRGGPGRSMYGTNALTEFKAARVDDNGKEHPVAFSMATSSINVPSRPLGAPFAVNGKQPEERVVGPVSYAIDGDTKTAWTTQGSAATRNQASEAVFVLDKPLVVPASNKLVLRLQQDHGGKLGNQRNTNIAGRFRFSVTDTADPVAEPLPAKVRQIVSRDIDGWDAADWFVVFSHWRTTRPEWSVANARIDELLDRFPQGVNQYVVTERSQDERRVTYRMDRGNFLSPDERIEPHTPAFLHPLRESDEPDRLRFARWLADRKSPTTARAIVNRVWQEYFGTGIVETTEDLGLQAPPASHPDLLDWLAVDLMEHGWSLKHLHRLIVTSATYRQTSSAIQSLLLADPNNRLLARGPRVRVQAEVVRDIALAASGLLNLRLGGPTVYPPAPKFLYLPPTSYGVKQWETSHDRADYRRSLYVQAYRSVPYPPMQLFDAPNGNAACVRRGRSNTPLQALALLNEPQFVECARALAGRIMESEDLDERSRIAVGFEMLLSRQPSDDEIEALANFVAAARAKLANGEVNAFDITGLPSDTDSEHCEELAAWTLAARCLLNLDETITKQ